MGNAQCVYFPKEHMRGLRVVGRAISSPREEREAAEQAIAEEAIERSRD